MTPDPEPITEPAAAPPDPDADSRFVCKCECGGDVRGVCDFGRQWTWCTACSPVVKIVLNRDGSFATPKPL